MQKVIEMMRLLSLRFQERAAGAAEATGAGITCGCVQEHLREQVKAGAALRARAEGGRPVGRGGAGQGDGRGLERLKLLPKSPLRCSLGAAYRYVGTFDHHPLRNANDLRRVMVPRDTLARPSCAYLNHCRSPSIVPPSSSLLDGIPGPANLAAAET